MCVPQKLVKLWIESTKKLTTRILKGMPREYQGQGFVLRRLGILGLIPRGEKKEFYYVALIREEVQVWDANVGSKKELPLCMLPC